MPVLFLSVVGVWVFLVLAIRRPFQAGRRPFALYDQIAYLGILVTSAGMSAGGVGATLWVAGISGLAVATIICVVTDAMIDRNPPQANWAVGLLYGCRCVLPGGSNIVTVLLVRWGIGS